MKEALDYPAISILKAGRSQVAVVQFMNNSGRVWVFNQRGESREFADVPAAARFAEAAQAYYRLIAYRPAHEAETVEETNPFEAWAV